MKKAYLAISYMNRSLFDKEIEALKRVSSIYDFELLVFVDRYHFDSNQEKEMMKNAFSEINNCDMLIAEVTTKAIGVGIEVGYAFAKNIPIVYIRKKGSKVSTTIKGCAITSIVYNNVDHLSTQLIEFHKITN